MIAQGDRRIVKIDKENNRNGGEFLLMDDY